MSYLCPGKEAEMVSDDFIAVSDVTETAVCDTERGSRRGRRIVDSGRATVRATFYMAALVAARVNSGSGHESVLSVRLA